MRRGAVDRVLNACRVVGMPDYAPANSLELFSFTIFESVPYAAMTSCLNDNNTSSLCKIVMRLWLWVVTSALNNIIVVPIAVLFAGLKFYATQVYTQINILLYFLMSGMVVHGAGTAFPVRSRHFLSRVFLFCTYFFILHRPSNIMSLLYRVFFHY